MKCSRSNLGGLRHGASASRTADTPARLGFSGRGQGRLPRPPLGRPTPARLSTRSGAFGGSGPPVRDGNSSGDSSGSLRARRWWVVVWPFAFGDRCTSGKTAVIRCWAFRAATGFEFQIGARHASTSALSNRSSFYWSGGPFRVRLDHPPGAVFVVRRGKSCCGAGRIPALDHSSGPKGMDLPEFGRAIVRRCEVCVH